jgi:hypothetical protein
MAAIDSSGWFQMVPLPEKPVAFSNSGASEHRIEDHDDYGEKFSSSAR